MTSTTKVRTNIFALFMETNGVPNINSNDAWWHLYKVPALAFPIKTYGDVWGGSQTYGDFNLVAKATGTGFTKTHQRQIWADLTLIHLGRPDPHPGPRLHPPGPAVLCRRRLRQRLQHHREPQEGLPVRLELV